MTINGDVIETKIESLIDLLTKLKEVLEEYKRNTSLQEFLVYAAEKKA